MAALRECTASLDARLSVIGAISDSENRDVDVGWPGIMSIRVYELDGMSDHPKLPMAGDRWQLLELPCHSKLAAKRYQKPKKGGKPDGADENVDALAPLDNKTRWVAVIVISGIPGNLKFATTQERKPRFESSSAASNPPWLGLKLTLRWNTLLRFTFTSPYRCG